MFALVQKYKSGEKEQWSTEHSWMWIRIRWQWWAVVHDWWKRGSRWRWDSLEGWTWPPVLVCSSDGRTDKWGQAGIFMHPNVCRWHCDVQGAGNLERRRSTLERSGKTAWKSSLEWRVTDSVWINRSVNKSHAASRHSWESQSSTLSLVTLSARGTQRPHLMNHHLRQWGHWNLCTVRLAAVTTQR